MAPPPTTWTRPWRSGSILPTRNILYAVQGVRGYTQGLWVSHDGGTTWAQPAGFIAVVKEIGTADMTTLTVDPSDFKHMLVGSHSWWKGLQNGGILETKDGGETFIKRQPVSSWPGGSMGIQFLYDPCLGIGDSNTWLVSTDGPGAFWRTTDAGATWTHLDGSLNGLHGQASLYYAKTGVVYSGAAAVSDPEQGQRRDLGEALDVALRLVHGDHGRRELHLHAQVVCLRRRRASEPWLGRSALCGISRERWGNLDFLQGRRTEVWKRSARDGLRSGGRVMYSANWQWGLWALRVVDP